MEAGIRYKTNTSKALPRPSTIPLVSRRNDLLMPAAEDPIPGLCLEFRFIGMVPLLRHFFASVKFTFPPNEVESQFGVEAALRRHGVRRLTDKLAGAFESGEV